MDSIQKNVATVFSKEFAPFSKQHAIPPTAVPILPSPSHNAMPPSGFSSLPVTPVSRRLQPINRNHSVEVESKGIISSVSLPSYQPVPLNQQPNFMESPVSQIQPSNFVMPPHVPISQCQQMNPMLVPPLPLPQCLNPVMPESTRYQQPNALFTPEKVDTPAQNDALMSSSELTKWFTKSCSRRNFASNLVRQLFSKEVRKSSNVAGRGKQMLDPVKISYVKSQCFEYFPLCGGEKVDDECHIY